MITNSDAQFWAKVQLMQISLAEPVEAQFPPVNAALQMQAPCPNSRCEGLVAYAGILSEYREKN